MNMGRAFIFVLSCCLALEAYSSRLSKALCQDSLCVYLYDTEFNHIGWNASQAECAQMGMELVWIESSQTQLLVERLISDLSPSKANQFWIGGRRNRDGQWRYMNGTEFSKQTLNNANPTSDCMHVTVCKNSEPVFTPDDCKTTKNSAVLLCQYNRSEAGECQWPHLQVGDKCYVKTKYGGRYPIQIDWYRGQTYCSRSPIKGDIAYSYLDEKDFISSIMRLYSNTDHGCIRLWLGVRRRIWLWNAGSGNNSDQVIDYFNWFTGSKKASSTGDCISINANKNDKWLASKCSYYMKYFICMYGTAAFKKHAVPTSKSRAVAGPTVDSHLSRIDYKTAYIVTLVMLFISIIVILAQIRCYLSSKRRPPTHISQRTPVTHNCDSPNSEEVPSTPLSTANNVRQLPDRNGTEYEEICEETDNAEISSEYLSMESPTQPCIYEIPSTYVNIKERSNTYTPLGN